MSWLLVERLVQVNDDDIGLLGNVKEIREDLDRLAILHLWSWRLRLNLVLRCFYPRVRDINLRRVPTFGRFVLRGPHLRQSNHGWCRVARGCDTENHRVN